MLSALRWRKPRSISILIKTCCRHQDHGTVDRPANDHGKQRVTEFIFQLLLNYSIIRKRPLAALNDFRMQKQIVRHHNRTEHTHDDRHGMGRKRRLYPADGSLFPVDSCDADLK